MRPLPHRWKLLDDAVDVVELIDAGPLQENAVCLLASGGELKIVGETAELLLSLKAGLNKDSLDDFTWLQSEGVLTLVGITTRVGVGQRLEPKLVMEVVFDSRLKPLHPPLRIEPDCRSDRRRRPLAGFTSL